MEQRLDAIAQLIAQGRPDKAAQLASEARANFPLAVEPARLHGVALFSMGRLDEAVVALREASALEPRSVETLCNLGSVLLARNDVHAALTVMQSARLIAPGHAAVLNGLGNALRAAGDARAARDTYEAAARAAPEFLGAWLNLAAAELALGQPAQCERIARMVLKQTPNAQAYLLLAQSLAAQHLLDEAADACREGERVSPGNPDLPYQLGQIADELKQPGLAAEAHARALQIDPNLSGALAQLVFIRRQLCDWRDLDRLSGRLREAVAAGASDVAPFGFLAEPATAAEQRVCAMQFAAAVGRRIDPLAARPQFRHAQRAPDAPLRIGFASNGFGNHPTGLLTVAFFEALSARGVDLQLFATAASDGSPVQQRLQAAAGAWHVLVDLPAAGMAERIAASELDILVDLRVWGGGNISEALALRPAPIQVNWLAYPGTSGADWIDYVIADHQVLPARLCQYFSEQVAWLPRCFQPSDPGRAVGQPPVRTECGLPASGAVYVCFNNSYKLDARSLERMFAILRGVPDAVLWLLAGPERSDANLRAQAAASGVDPDRLVFMAKLPHADYLARYRHADLFLDTATYNAHTTASDAIWAGCPVLTSAGETFASRVASSLNHHLGMTELNVADDAAFVEFALRVGRERSVRDALHARLAVLRGQGSLFDMDGFAADFMALLQAMAHRHRTGQAAAPID
ncbi:O-linked N-acetylglucosamine transferase family protein [Dokdonella immobilis]|uniref:O-linked N-acetylglucosamine transferase family protein n=1 Tax=Dokdonella immobilis TaxID=578942 RepID=UPI00158737D2|nr:tetratricopeptide repeat protein [Dokdonella immobilis]